MRIKICQIALAMVLVMSLCLVMATPASAAPSTAVTNVTVGAPLTGALLPVKAGNDVSVTYTITLDADPTSTDVDIQIYNGSSTISSWTGTLAGYTSGTPTTTPMSTAGGAAEGNYDVRVKARCPTGTGTWFTATIQTNAVKVDNTGPILSSIVWTDQDTSTDINTGDKIAFTFNEAMATATIPNVAATINAVLATASGHGYGNGATSAWTVGNTVVTITLGGAGITVVSGDTVNPTNAVTDAQGNIDATVTPQTILDNVGPTLISIAKTDTDTSGTYTGGDRLAFTFSEAMTASTITTVNIGTALPILSGSKTYGTADAGMSASWNGAGTVLTVILGTDTTIVGSETVNPAGTVTDVAGNVDATAAPGAVIPAFVTGPVLSGIVWTDVDNSGTVNTTDTLKFTFSREMDPTTIPAVSATINTVLAPSGGHNYGNAVTCAWTVGNTVVTLTLAGAGTTVVVGDTVNPTNAVTDTTPTADATVGTGPAVVGGPTLTKILWHNADNSGTPKAGDTLQFTFSAAMDTTTIDNAGLTADADTVLAPSAGNYGTSGAASVVWTGNTIVTVTLGAAPTITSARTVNPTAEVTSAAGLSETTTAGVGLDQSPYLTTVTWTDSSGDKAIGTGDTIAFTFSVGMDAATIPNTPATINAVLATATGHSYGSTVSRAWNGGVTVVTLTLGGTGITVVSGDTVNPTSAVTDAAGNPDSTVTALSITDALAPLLNSIVLIDKDSSGTRNAGDQVVFTFSEAMNTSTVTASNVNSVLASGSRPFDYGTIASGVSVAWDGAGKVLTVTLGSNGTITNGDAVTPAASVTDAAGIAYAAGPVTVYHAPRLVSIVWTEVSVDGYLNATDTLAFTFSENMTAGDIPAVSATINAVLAPASGHSYGAGVTRVWTAANIVTLTLIGVGINVVVGDTVNPTSAVTDANIVADETQGTGPAIVIAAAAPTITSVVGTAVNNADDTIVIQFSENVTGAATAANWTLSAGPSVPGLIVLAITNSMLGYVDATDIAPATLTVTLPEPGLYLVNGDVVRATPAAGITDVDGNTIATGADDAMITSDAVPPTFTFTPTVVVGANDTIVLTFSEYVQPITGKTWALTGATSVFANIESPTGSALTLTGATVLPSGSSATKTVTISLAELTADLQTGDSVTVILNNNQVADLAGGLITGAGNLDGNSPQAAAGDTTAPTFTIGYYSDSGLTTAVTNDYLKAGTYYIKITANEKLVAAPTISISAEGVANDVTNAATTMVSGNTVYSYTYVVRIDPASLGQVADVITITGTDLAGNLVTGAAVTGEKWTDTTAPASVTLNYPNGGESLTAGNTATITWSATDTYTPDASLVIMLEYYNGSAWNTIVASTTNNNTYSWTVPSVSSSSCLVRVTASDTAGNTRNDVSNAYFTISPASTPPSDITSITLQAGWNFISVPSTMAASNDTFGELLSGVTFTRAFAYDASLGSPWVTVSGATLVLPLQGYWIEVTTPATITLTFATGGQTVPPSKVLTGQAWNAIGVSSATAQPASTVLASIAGSWSTLIGWNAVGQAYQTAIITPGSQNINPGQGYWIWVTAGTTVSSISY